MAKKLRGSNSWIREKIRSTWKRRVGGSERARVAHKDTYEAKRLGNMTDNESWELRVETDNDRNLER